MKAPKVKLEQIINVGNKTAIVSNINNENSKKIEVVYFDDNNKALNEDVIWEDSKWRFIEGASAGYADNYDRTRPFVEKLHSYLFLKSKGFIM